MGDGTLYRLNKPKVRLVNAAYGAIDASMLMSPRRIPTVFDTGLLEQIAHSELETRADPHDKDKDGISGRINWIPTSSGGTKFPGRFGWKATNPTLDNQVAGALHFDMGLTTSLIGDGNCTKNQNDCWYAPDGGVPEVNHIQFTAVVEFARNLRSLQTTDTSIRKSRAG